MYKCPVCGTPHELEQTTRSDYSPTETQILNSLMKHPGRLRSMGDIIGSIYGSNGHRSPEWAEQSIRVMITRLRKKGVKIDNVRGEGWRIGG